MAMNYREDEAFAREQDAADPLRSCRGLFHVPAGAGGGEAVYLSGNSLGLQPKAARAGEGTGGMEEVAAFCGREGQAVAMVLLGAVNCLTGQWFRMEAITAAAKRAGCIVGWDLAHAAGNVPMRLHDWGVDFAAWCTYKYLNAGPGAVAGAFVHERHTRGGGGTGPARHGAPE